MNQMDKIINSKLNEELTIKEKIKSLLNKNVYRQVPTLSDYDPESRNSSMLPYYNSINEETKVNLKE